MNSVLAAILMTSCLVLLTSASALPAVAVEDVSPQDVSPLNPLEFADVEVEEHGDRHRRVTCDVLSLSTPIGSLNHAACAAHCLAMRKGYRGGRCIDGVCNCRR